MKTKTKLSKLNKEVLVGCVLATVITLLSFYAHEREESATERRDKFLDRVSDYKEQAEYYSELEELFSRTGTFYMAVDDQARIIDVSGSFLSELGYGKNELIGKNLHTMFKVEFRSAHSRKFDKAMQQVDGQYGHYLNSDDNATILRKDGSELKLQVALRINPHVGGVAFCWKINN